MKISAPIREKKVTFLFAPIVDFTSHKLWAQDVPSSGSKVSSNAERHFEPWKQDRAASGSAALDPSNFFSFRLVIDALMENVPMALHMYKWGLLRDQDGAAAIAAHLGHFFWGAPARQVSR